MFRILFSAFDLFGVARHEKPPGLLPFLIEGAAKEIPLQDFALLGGDLVVAGIGV